MKDNKLSLFYHRGEGMETYMKLSSFIWWRQYFMYIDTEDYLADRTFIHEKVRIKFGKEFGKAKSKYIAIIASCRVKDWDKAERALKSLPAAMSLLGHLDYEDKAKAIISKLESERERLRVS